jgi:UDP-N-acetylmuramyl pentapeptide phosphotransferase/UDP-N-acetylglucosamine-1-phosphate transferase
MQLGIQYISVFLIGLAVAWALVPLLKKVAPALGMVDEPSERRIHKVPIPRSGGIALFVATHLAILAVFLASPGTLAGAIQAKEWGLLLVGSLVLLLIGIFDDRFGMRAWLKLAGQLAVALMMFFGGFTFEAFLHIPLPFVLDLGATLFWFALLVNAFNLIDGMDGACAGLGLIASAGLSGMLISLGQPASAIVLLALAGACFGFLRYNFNPASIFLGDCGSMFIGFMLAAVSLQANVKQSMMVALLIPLLAVGVPVFDVMLAVWRRLARKLLSKIHKEDLATKIFGPDLDHIHHKLMRSGMSQRKAAIALYIAAALVCLIALGATAMHSNHTALLMIGMIVVLHIVVRQIAQVELWTTTQVVLQGVRRPRNLVGVLVAMGWDIICLLLVTLFVFEVVLSHSVNFSLMAICVMIPFATIYFYGIYKSVWTRSRISQLVVLVLQLTAGEVLAFVALVWVTDLPHMTLLIALLLHSLGALMGIVGIRASFRVVRDMGAWLRCSVARDQDNARTLILGAGENAILYLRQASFENQQKAPRKVMGLIDDNPALYGKIVYGYPVLGHFSELEKLIQKHNITELIFTHHYSDALRESVLALKSKYNLLIRDFIFVLRDLDQKGMCAGLVKPYSVDDIDCRNLCSKVEGAESIAECMSAACADHEAAIADSQSA